MTDVRLWPKADRCECSITHILDGVVDIGFIVHADDNHVHRRAPKVTPNMILQSTITCPNCGSAKVETMPTDACQYFYNCASCGVRLKPTAGDCCVFCSYGDLPCPPVQEAREKNEPSACGAK